MNGGESGTEVQGAVASIESGAVYGGEDEVRNHGHHATLENDDKSKRVQTKVGHGAVV